MPLSLISDRNIKASAFVLLALLSDFKPGHAYPSQEWLARQIGLSAKSSGGGGSNGARQVRNIIENLPAGYLVVEGATRKFGKGGRASNRYRLRALPGEEFGMVPKELLTNPDLSPAAKRFAAAWAFVQGDKVAAWPTKTCVAELAAMSRSRGSRAFDDLVRADCLTEVYPGNGYEDPWVPENSYTLPDYSWLRDSISGNPIGQKGAVQELPVTLSASVQKLPVTSPASVQKLPVTSPASVQKLPDDPEQSGDPDQKR